MKEKNAKLKCYVYLCFFKFVRAALQYDPKQGSDNEATPVNSPRRFSTDSELENFDRKFYITPTQDDKFSVQSAHFSSSDFTKYS